ncbi:hypothetical protein PInf_003777 [Phytophthora infestans]|nr:hypothetical protein PInf_003777 [Phytophthora infestans]
MSLNVQEYEVRGLRKKGPATVGILTKVQDMQAQTVETFYMVARSYPYLRVPTFEMYERVGVTSDSYRELLSIPRDPYTQPVLHLVTARKRGFYNGDTQRNVRVMYSSLDGLNAKTALTRWEWIGRAGTQDSWAWTIYSLIVLFLVTYQKIRSGKVWIGDPFSTISTADLVLRGILVLVSCFLDNFWSVNEYAMSRASMLTGSQTVLVHKEIMHADILVIVLSMAGQSTDTSGSEKAAMSTRGIVTNFELSTGAMLRTRFGLISDYNNYVYFKGMKFASPDGVYCSGYVIVNGKFLVSTKNLLAIVMIKLVHARLTNVYVYEVDGNTVKETARLVYPNTFMWSDLWRLNVTVLL